MLIHRQPESRWAAAVPAALLLVAAGFLVGFLLAPARQEHAGTQPQAATPQPTPPLLPKPRESTGELPLLEVAIAPSDWEILSRHRDKALAAKFLFPDPNAIVRAAVRIGSESATGTAQLKGDWTDHYDTDQWSLRFELETPIRGMRRFSIQHPKTRGYVMEWLVMQTAKRLGLLAPRTMFVQVAVNDRRPGVYYLEERPGKAMLEHLGRRDGPIVKFGEDALWSTHMQLDFLTVGVLPSDFERMYQVFDASAEVLGEARLRKVEALNQRVHRAMQQARDLQRLITTADMQGNSVRVLQNLRQLQGRTVDDLFVAEKTGKALALYTLYQGFHGLLWNQLRLYHDPVLDRLEPVVNDTGASLLHRPGELVVASPDARWFRGSHDVLIAAYEELGRMTEPDWIPALIAELRPGLVAAANAMKAAGIEIPGFDVLDSLDVLMRQQADRLRAFVRPHVAANFTASVIGLRLPSGEDRRAVEIDVRATSKVPTRVSRFVFGNGRALSAMQTLVGIVGEPESADLVTTLAGEGVMLPTDGRALRFRFPIDQRLTGLSEVQAIKRAIRQRVAGPATAELEITAAFRPVSEREDRTQLLLLRAPDDATVATKGRPEAPDLWTALERHPFLTYDLDTMQLRVRAGRHDVKGDLVLPDTHALHLDAGAELRFAADAVLVAGALQVHGLAGNPARVVAASSEAGFAGILVLGTAGPSQASFFEIEGATAIARGGWQTTGGVTFLHRPVELRDCKFTAARGEDALNILGARFLLERCTFAGGPSDLFDGDFVNGDIVDCTFSDSGEDAIDVSGSQVNVRGCTFARIGDKALSVGEGSRLLASDCNVLSASIAMAAKDRSTAIARRLTVGQVEHFVFAAYIKKPEFGACTLEATDLRWQGSGEPKHLAQTGCRIEIDGTAIPTTDIDVDELYRTKVLGK